MRLAADGAPVSVKRRAVNASIDLKKALYIQMPKSILALFQLF
jgi:hypothetical protein